MARLCCLTDGTWGTEVARQLSIENSVLPPARLLWQSSEEEEKKLFGAGSWKDVHRVSFAMKRATGEMCRKLMESRMPLLEIKKRRLGFSARVVSGHFSSWEQIFPGVCKSLQQISLKYIIIYVLLRLSIRFDIPLPSPVAVNAKPKCQPGSRLTLNWLFRISSAYALTVSAAVLFGHRLSHQAHKKEINSPLLKTIVLSSCKCSNKKSN